MISYSYNITRANSDSRDSRAFSIFASKTRIGWLIASVSGPAGFAFTIRESSIVDTVTINATVHTCVRRWCPKTFNQFIRKPNADYESRMSAK